MIWSDKAIDYSKGVRKDLNNNTILPNSIGCYVFTLNECEKIIKEKREKQKKNGNDTNKEII